MSNDVQISVRTLVEYVYRSGSIDSRFRLQSSLSDGTRIHQKIQKTYHETDQKAVYLRTEIPFETLSYCIDGRCDGLLFGDDGVTIDEIKSFFQPLDRLAADGFPVHWHKRKCIHLSMQRNINYRKFLSNLHMSMLIQRIKGI